MPLFVFFLSFSLSLVSCHILSDFVSLSHVQNIRGESLLPYIPKKRQTQNDQGYQVLLFFLNTCSSRSLGGRNLPIFDTVRKYLFKWVGELNHQLVEPQKKTTPKTIQAQPAVNGVRRVVLQVQVEVDSVPWVDCRA